MNWHTAFLVQARSDDEIRRLLNKSQVPYAHELHYLQMTWEKLAKGVLLRENGDDLPFKLSHRALVDCLHCVKADPRIRRFLRYKDSSSFTRYINSLIPLAEQIERLAPSLAGTTQPNPEYPWQPLPGGPVEAPARYGFPQFNPSSWQMKKLDLLLDDLLRFYAP
jgi:hypothetical protein